MFLIINYEQDILFNKNISNYKIINPPKNKYAAKATQID